MPLLGCPQEKKPEVPKLSKKKLRRMNRFTVAELKQVTPGTSLSPTLAPTPAWALSLSLSLPLTVSPSPALALAVSPTQGPYGHLETLLGTLVSPWRRHSRLEILLGTLVSCQCSPFAH